MSPSRRRSLLMVEQQIEWIRKSTYPNSDLCEGMIQANLAHGYISQREALELTRRAHEAESARRAELHQQNIARHLADFHRRQEGKPCLLRQ